jgi:hypothetical protein
MLITKIISDEGSALWLSKAANVADNLRSDSGSNMLKLLLGVDTLFLMSDLPLEMIFSDWSPVTNSQLENPSEKSAARGLAWV